MHVIFCRHGNLYTKAVLQFLLDYPLKKKLQSYLNLFVSNLRLFKLRCLHYLSNTYITVMRSRVGRESVLEMLSVIFAKFPQVTDIYSEFCVHIRTFSSDNSS